MHKDYQFISLLSGMDSFVATHLYKESGKHGMAIIFDYGQPPEETEIAEKLANILGMTLEIILLDMDILRIGDSPFYPFRNAIFLATAANYVLTRTESRTIITGLGTTSDDPAVCYPDASASFINSLLYALNLGVPDTDTINIVSPISSWTKKEIFNWLVTNDLDEVIPLTTSCYENPNQQFPWGVGCNVCPHCISRKMEYRASLANPAIYKAERKIINGQSTRARRVADKLRKS